MFPRYFVPRGWKPFLVSGARALLLRLDAMNAVDDMSRVRMPAPPPAAFEARLRLLSKGKGGRWAADRNNGSDPACLAYYPHSDAIRTPLPWSVEQRAGASWEP